MPRLLTAIDLVLIFLNGIRVKATLMDVFREADDGLLIILFLDLSPAIHFYSHSDDIQF